MSSLRIALVGCGKIADQHLTAIQRIPFATVVAVCDRELLMAEQLAERFAVGAFSDDLEQVLRDIRPDVVHISTPPQSHFALAIKCLEAGCHVLIEKPFTVNANEAEQLIAAAESLNLSITVGHDEQFSPGARRMRELVRRGYLGGRPVHVESIWCYDISDEVYAKALLADTHHWVRGLPGGLLHNVISHGIAKIAEFLTDGTDVLTLGRTSPILSRLGENTIVDELRVVIADSQKTTAYFTFSSQMKPAAHQLFIYGPANGLLVDEDRQTVVRLRGGRYKSYLEQFIPPLILAREQIGNWTHNVGRFLASDFHADSGRRHLIEKFYRSILDKTPPPIPYREILLTAQIMDSVFEQLLYREKRPATLSSQ